MTEALQKLAALDKAASPGPWEKIGINDEEHAKALEANDAFTAWVYDSDPASDVGGEEVATFDANDLRQNDANAKLAALSHLLLPAVTAMAPCPYLDEGEPCSERQTIEWQCRRCKVLSQLEEALK